MNDDDNNFNGGNGWMDVFVILSAGLIIAFLAKSFIGA